MPIRQAFYRKIIQLTDLMVKNRRINELEIRNTELERELTLLEKEIASIKQREKKVEEEKRMASDFYDGSVML